MTYRLFFVCCILFAGWACAPTAPYVWVQDLPPAPAAPVLRVGDRVQVAVQAQDAMNGEFEVRPGGEIVLPQVGRMVAAGFTADQLREQLTARLRGFFQNPQVTVVLAGRRAPFVSVVGEVRTPGRYELREREGVLDALARAGGFTPFASKDSIYVIERLRSGPRVRFRYQDLAGAQPKSVNFELRDGDVVIVE